MSKVFKNFTALIFSLLSKMKIQVCCELSAKTFFEASRKITCVNKF